MSNKRPLQAARGSQTKGRAPSADTLTQGMRMSTTAEAARYLHKKASDLFLSLGLMDKDSVKQVVSILDTHAKKLERAEELGTENLWNGKPLPSAQEVSADHAAKDLEKIMAETLVNNLTLDFAVGKGAELLRGYSANGASADPELVKVMDKLFSSWLAENEKISKGGVIYEGTKDGQLKRDKLGNPVKTDPEALREKIASKTDGFEPYVQEHNKSVQLTIHQRAHPDQPAPGEEAGPSGSTGAG